MLYIHICKYIYIYKIYHLTALKYIYYNINYCFEYNNFFCIMLRSIRKYSASKFFITTPIYYVNACKSCLYCKCRVSLSKCIFLAPHLGHLYSSLIADCIFRFKHLTNNLNSSIFSTGTDEHGIKVFQAANDQNVNVKQYCDKISGDYESLFNAAQIQHTDFVRTTEERHKIAVHSFWVHT